jgi:hypothetical protein
LEVGVVSGVEAGVGMTGVVLLPLDEGLAPLPPPLEEQPASRARATQAAATEVMERWTRLFVFILFLLL